MTVAALFVTAVMAAAIVFVLRRSRRPSPHQRAVRDVLDAADALEDRLRTARAEVEAVAGEAGADPIRDAMKEMLRQRLWLRDHADGASPEQLADIREEIDAARSRIEHQLARIEEARAPRG